MKYYTLTRVLREAEHRRLNTGGAPFAIPGLCLVARLDIAAQKFSLLSAEDDGLAPALVKTDPETESMLIAAVIKIRLICLLLL